MSEIKLRAKRKNTEDWLMFNLSDLFHSVETGLYQVCVEDVGLFAIDPATIQLADDPRKAMLDELRLEINKLREYKSFVRVEGDPVPTLPQIEKWCVIWILDEMEAKL